MKVMRIVVLVKFAAFAVHKVFRPQAVATMKVGSLIVRDEVRNGILAFFILFITIFFGASIVMALLGLDLVSATTAAAATLGNIGPGLASVGATQNYAHIPDVGKLVLAACMLFGRLEIYTVLVLFAPAFWRK